MESNIKFLLDYCEGKEELYNKISNKLYAEFGLRSAELSLLCTFIANETIGDVIREIEEICINSECSEDYETNIEEWLERKEN